MATLRTSKIDLADAKVVTKSNGPHFSIIDHTELSDKLSIPEDQLEFDDHKEIVNLQITKSFQKQQAEIRCKQVVNDFVHSPTSEKKSLSPLSRFKFHQTFPKGRISDNSLSLSQSKQLKVVHWDNIDKSAPKSPLQQFVKSSQVIERNGSKNETFEGPNYLSQESYQPIQVVISNDNDFKIVNKQLIPKQRINIDESTILQDNSLLKSKNFDAKNFLRSSFSQDLKPVLEISESGLLLRDKSSTSKDVNQFMNKEQSIKLLNHTRMLIKLRQEQLANKTQLEQLAQTMQLVNNSKKQHRTKLFRECSTSIVGPPQSQSIDIKSSILHR